MFRQCGAYIQVHAIVIRLKLDRIPAHPVNPSSLFLHGEKGREGDYKRVRVRPLLLPTALPTPSPCRAHLIV